MTMNENIKKDDNELEVELINWNSSKKLGFSIVGGVGNPFIRGDSNIYIHTITDGSVISWDGRIWVGDQLVGAKESLGAGDKRYNFDNCTQDEVAAVLRKMCQQKKVVLIVRKTEITLINWQKNDSLGFSIGGGSNREHIPGDSRIYITNVIEGGSAAMSNRISVGDQLLGVRRHFDQAKQNAGLRSEDFFLMHHCTHEVAVLALQAARTGKQISLIIRKMRHDQRNKRRLRFDDPPIEKNQTTSTQIQLHLPKETVLYGQKFLPKSTFLPHPSCSQQQQQQGSVQKARSILKIKTPDQNKPHDSAATINNSCDNDDSALSSMSSEDESRLLDFSHILKDMTLTATTTFKPRHHRQASKHVIVEPNIYKLEAPSTNFSAAESSPGTLHKIAPNAKNNRMIWESTNGSNASTMSKSPAGQFSNNPMIISATLKENCTMLPEDLPSKVQPNRYFYKRYQLEEEAEPKWYSDEVMSHEEPKLIHFNTKQFSKAMSHHVPLPFL